MAYLTLQRFRRVSMNAPRTITPKDIYCNLLIQARQQYSIRLAYQSVGEVRAVGMQKFGFTSNGMRRFRYKDWGRTFPVLTTTIFGSHAIHLAE